MTHISHLRVIENIEARFGFPIYYSGLRIIMFLYDSEESSGADIMLNTAISRSKTYSLLKEFVKFGIVDASLLDRRKIKCTYSLSAPVRGELNNNFRRFETWFTSDNKREMSAFNMTVNRAPGISRSQTKVKYYTCKYLIIRYLYNNNPMCASELLNACATSSSSFFCSLNFLENRGFIKSESDPADSRKKRYFLTSLSRDILDEELASLKLWYTSKKL